MSVSVLICLAFFSLAASYELNTEHEHPKFDTGSSDFEGASLPKKERLGHISSSGGFNFLRPGAVNVPYNFGGNPDTLDSGLTVTELSTFDTYSTTTETFYNSVPVTLTEFIKSTVTIPTEEVLRTDVDDVVRITTIKVTKPSTHTVTDVSSVFSCVTEVSTDVYTITHFDQRVLQTILTSTIVHTHTFRPTIVQTRIQTEVAYETETIAYTNTAWIEVVLSTFTKYH